MYFEKKKRPQTEGRQVHHTKQQESLKRMTESHLVWTQFTKKQRRIQEAAQSQLSQCQIFH